MLRKSEVKVLSLGPPGRYEKGKGLGYELKEPNSIETTKRVKSNQRNGKKLELQSHTYTPERESSPA
jgi:hypothetical protein